MPSIHDLKTSKYLSKEDVGAGMLVTMTEVTHENLAMQGQPADMKYVLHFHETEKPLVLNLTNGESIAEITGFEEFENWTGHKIVLYVDKTVAMQGKRVGGIRVRAPRGAAAAPARPAPAPAPRPAARPSPAPVEQDPESGQFGEDPENEIPF